MVKQSLSLFCKSVFLLNFDSKYNLQGKSIFNVKSYFSTLIMSFKILQTN